MQGVQDLIGREIAHPERFDILFKMSFGIWQCTFILKTELVDCFAIFKPIKYKDRSLN